MEINVSKCYQPPNRKLISKYLLGVIHDQNMEMKLSLTKKDSDIFGLLFIGDGATISINPLMNILVSGKNLPVAVLLRSVYGTPLRTGKMIVFLY